MIKVCMIYISNPSLGNVFWMPWPASETNTRSDPSLSAEHADRQDEDAASEGTDIEDSFSPSPRDELTLSTHSALLSHSPPEPLSPTKQKQLKDELSPLYDVPPDVATVGVTLGRSPSDFIAELPEEDELDRQTVHDEQIDKTDSEPTHYVKTYSKTEKTSDGDTTHTVTETKMVTETHEDGTVTTQTVKTTSHVEYMSFDNVGFMGKTRIDEADEMPAVVIHEPAEKSGADISPESDSDKYGDECIKELKEHASIAVNDEAIRKASAPHIEIPPHIEMKAVLDEDSPEHTEHHVLETSDSFDRDQTHAAKGGPPIMAELDTDDSVDTLVAEKEVLEMPVTEPHEMINDAHTYSVIETISERHTHDLHIPGEYLMHSGSFRIGQIEYVPREDEDEEPQPPEESSTPDLSPNEMPVYETLSETLLTSTMTASFQTAKTSLESSTMLDSSTTTFQSGDSFEGDIMPKIKEPEIEDRQDSRGSIESDELEERYDNQLEEMEQEMQRNIAPSPLPPASGHITIEEEEVSLEMEEAADEVQQEMTAVPDRRESDVVQTKHGASLSSESLVKTSTSSDASAEPTLLAATYDLELGAVSHVVATYDISPDSVEKRLPMESKPKAILSSPEDEVFEYDSLGQQIDRTPDKTSEHDDERISSPFEVISESDLTGFEEYSLSKEEAGTSASACVLPIAIVPVTVPGAGISESSHEPETPTFDQSSPASSSVASEAKELSPSEPAVEALESHPTEPEQVFDEQPEQPKPEAFLMLNGPTEVEYTPEHDDGLMSQRTPADTMADISEVDTDREAQEEKSATTSLMEEASGPTGTESVMEDLSVPDPEKMLTSDQTLFDLEMPTEEASLRSFPTEGEVSEMESKSHEMEVEQKQETEEKFEDASSCSKLMEKQTSDVPPSYAAEALKPEPMDTEEKEDFPTGKAMLESDAAYEIFGEAVLSDVPQSYAQEVVQDKEPDHEEDECLMATGLEPGVTLEEEMMHVLQETSQPQSEFDEGSLAAEVEQPDSELLALADEEEDDDKIQTGTEFSTIEEPSRPKGLDIDEGASLRPDAMDIDRPMSPIPDPTRVMWDDPEITERLHQMEQEATEEEAKLKEEEKEESHSEDSSAVLEVQAAVFVHGVLSDVQASMLREQQDDVTEQDQDLSTDLDSQRTDISEVHVHTPDPEATRKRPPLEPQASEDIPTISITQHLHAETKEEDYPTTYARGASLDLLDEDEEQEEPMQTTEHEEAQELRSGPQDYEMPQETVCKPTELNLQDKSEYSHSVDPFLGTGHIDEIGPDIMDMKDRPEIDSPEQEVLSNSSNSLVEDPEASSGQETDSDEERARYYTQSQEQHFLAEGLEVRQEMDTIVEVSEPEESPVEDAHPHDADSGDEDFPIGVMPQVEATDLVSPEDMGDSSSVDSFATVVALQPDGDDDVEDRLAEVSSMTSSFHSEITPVYQEEQPEPAISIDVRDLPVDLDLDKSSSTSSDKIDTVDKDSLNDVPIVTPDDDKFDMILQKDKSQKSTSEELLILAGTGQMSPGNISTTGQFFYSKSGDKDDISISSSLLEFESLEKEVQDKVSIDSLERASSKKIYSKSGDNDDISISSSLAEFETLEKEITESKEKISGESKSSLDTSSHSSLAEFEKLERELQNESDERRSSSDSNGKLEKTSQKSSTSSLAEFEHLEEQILIDEELQVEAQKVVSMLESGALMAEMGHPGDSPLMSPPQQAMSVEHLQDQVVPDIEMPLEPEELDDQVPDSEEKMDHDSLSDSDEERIFHMENVVLEASLNVESFEKARLEEAGETDSLDDKDEQVVPLTVTAVTAANLDVVPAEHVTRDIDADSLQDSESHSKSGAMDTDSLHDPDSVMAASAESFEFDPAPGVTTEAALISAGLISQDIMAHSSDSIDPSIPIIPVDTDMTRSSDSLEMEIQIQRSHSTQSFDHDSLHDESFSKTTVLSVEDMDQKHDLLATDMMLSSESGAWSQTSSGEVSPQKTVMVEKTVHATGGVTTTRVIQTTRHTTYSEDNISKEIKDSAFFDTEGNVLHDPEKQTRTVVYEKQTQQIEPDVGKLTFSYTTTSSTEGGRDSESFCSPQSDPAFQNTPSTQSSPTDSSHSDTCYCGPDSAVLASQGWPITTPSTGGSTYCMLRILYEHDQPAGSSIVTCVGHLCFIFILCVFSFCLQVYLVYYFI